ncbi:MAG: HugZ family pyridoxamine 5'-phosphate oxidase [Myxococcaceae bacterium]
MNPSASVEVRQALLSVSSGTLGTLSVDPHCLGYPFLSVVPYALDAQGTPLLQLADIAQHTHNSRADPRASLMIQQPNAEGDPQSAWRVTVLGKIAPVSDAALDEALARYVERVPKAREYEQTHSFTLYRLSVERVRYIGGFGKIFWLDGKDALRDPQGAGLAEAAPGAVEHMNKDHAASMVEMCQGVYDFKPEHAELISIDRAGMLVKTRAPDRLCHFSFGKEIDAEGIRPAVIGVMKRARSALSSPAA